MLFPMDAFQEVVQRIQKLKIELQKFKIYKAMDYTAII